MHNLRCTRVVLLLAGLCAGCDGLLDRDPTPPPDAVVYDENELRLEHPSTWLVSSGLEDYGSFELATVELTSPRDSTIVVQDYRPTLDLGLRWFVNVYIKGLHDQSEHGPGFSLTASEREETTHVLMGKPQPGIRMRLDDVSPAETVPVELEIIRAEDVGHVLFLIFQAEGEAIEADRRAWRWMLETLDVAGT